MKNLILPLLLSAFSFSLAGDLLNSSMRPRMGEVVREHKDYSPDAGIPIKLNNLRFEEFLRTLGKDAPEFIVELENAYPGATFAFIGRDTQTIADVVDTFYNSIGQKNRVAYVAFSKPTAEALGDGEIASYMKSFGLDLNEVSSEKPFILIDTVSSGATIDNVLISGRQGRQILNGIYRAWIKKGKDPSDLLDKVNMIALRVSTFDSNDEHNKERYGKIDDIKKIHKKNAKNLKAGIPNDRLGYDFVLPIIKDSSRKFNESGYTHYTGEWHGKFGKPRRDARGRYVPAPGAASTDEERKSILWLQNQIIDLVFSDGFRQKVLKEAKDKDVVFTGFELQDKQVCSRVFKKR